MRVFAFIAMLTALFASGVYCAMGQWHGAVWSGATAAWAFAAIGGSR